MTNFTANIIVVENSEDCVLVGFAHQQDGEFRDALHFQRSHEFDDQDVSTGMDLVYLERDDQLQSGYGGIEQVELQRNRLTITIDQQMADRLGDDTFEIEFDLMETEFERLRTGLRAVFRGFDVLVELPR